MANELFVISLAVLLGVLLFWSFRALPHEGRQIIASVPLVKDQQGLWQGLNLTYYGLFVSLAVVSACALLFVLLGSIGIRIGITMAFIVLVLPACACAAKIVARVVERKRHTLTVGGATFVAIFLTPAAVALANLLLGWSAETKLPMIATLSALAVAYAMGEGIGRLACISFGCCYGKPVADCGPVIQRIIGRHAFVFSGKTKKIAYESNMEGQEVVPIQAITSVVFVGVGLISLFLYLNSHFFASLLTAMITTQAWRTFSETLRADYRGSGKISAYQIMAGIAVICTIVLGAVTSTKSVPTPDLLSGLKSLWDPGVIFFLQGVCIMTFLYTGRSMVTGSTMSFHVHADRT
jgi:prolipoprotein diacylglyceryltransferase